MGRMKLKENFKTEAFSSAWASEGMTRGAEKKKGNPCIF
jgi:hypothetical protein